MLIVIEIGRWLKKVNILSTKLLKDPNNMMIPDNFNIPSKSQGKTWTKQKTELSSTLLSGASFYKVYCQSAGVQQLALGQSINDVAKDLKNFNPLLPSVDFFIKFLQSNQTCIYVPINMSMAFYPFFKSRQNWASAFPKSDCIRTKS